MNSVQETLAQVSPTVNLLSTHVAFIQRGDRPDLRFLRTDNTRYPRVDHALQGSPAGRIQWSLGTRLPFDASKGGSDNGLG